MKKRFLEWLISFLMPGYHVHIHRTRARKENPLPVPDREGAENA